MKATLFAVLGIVLSAGCGASPSAPTPATGGGGGSGGTLILSGVVYGVDAAGRRPLAGAIVEIAESATAWGSYGRPTTDAAGRYTFGSLPVRHYVARASRPGYDASPVVTIGFLETSRSLDFELMTTGLVTGPLAVTAIDPASGSTGGGTDVKITGSGFQTGTTVTFGGERTTAYVHNSTTIYTTTPVHAVATVDVILTKPDGESATLTGGFRYAAPQSFNFNGTWIGYALAHPYREGRLTVLHSDMDMQFTIQDNVLTAFTCGGSTIGPLAPPAAVSNGEFAFAGDNVTLTGRIVSEAGAIGTIHTLACPNTRWAATRQ